jgi:Fic family protein
MAIDQPLSEDDVAQARRRRLEAMKLQEIEGNPLTADEVAMFEMFERERWSHERRRAYILAAARHIAAE